MAINLNFLGTGGIIEGNLGAANVNVNLDALYDLDGSDDFFYAADNAAFDLSAEFTLSAWIKPTGDGETWQIVMAKNGAGGSDANRPYAMWYHQASQRIYLYIGDNSTYAALSTDADTVIPNVWQHVAISFQDSSNTARIYINGKQVKVGTSLNITPHNTSQSFSIGAAYDNDSSRGEEFKGQIADVKLYSTILTDATILALSSKIYRDPELLEDYASLKAWYKLNNSTADSKGSLTLTASGSPAADYDAFSVDVYDNSTTTDGTFTVTQGKVEGLALSHLAFDGDDFVTLGSNSIGTNHTISAWVKVNNDGNNKTIFDFRDANNDGVLVWSTASELLQYQLNSVDATSTSAHTVSWVHVIACYDGTTQKLFINGVLDASNTTSQTVSVSTDAFIGARSHTGRANFFNGNIRDLKIFDYALSDEQAASLYSGTYPQTPQYWYKLDEGSGTAVEDHGTATDVDGTITGATYTNGTLDLDGTLTIAANGTLSAPRGNLDLANVAFAKNASGTFTHNNGNVKFSTAGGSSITTSDPVLYDLEINQGGSNLDVTTNLTIEHNLTVTSGMVRPQPDTKGSELTMTFGTTSYASQLELDSYGIGFESGGNNTHAAAFVGASSLYPFKVLSSSSAGIDLDSGGSSSKVKLANIDYDKDITSGGGGVTVTLTGDAEFNAFTVSSGDTLDLNGQRMEASGLIDINGAFKDTTTTGASLIVAEGWNTAGSSGNNTATTAGERLNLILNNTGSDDSNMFYSASSIYYDNIFVNGGEFTSYAGFGNQHTENFRIGSTFDVDHGWEMKNLTVCTGGTLDAGSQTLNCSGDFTTSGGLLGASAITLDGGSPASKFVSCNDTVLNGATTFTIEAWIKPDVNNLGFQTIVCARDGGNDGVALSMLNQTLRLRIGDGGSDDLVTDNVITTAGKWYHVVGLRDSSNNTKIYVNGKLVKQGTSSKSISISQDLKIGVQSYDNNNGFDGSIDEVRIFNDERTQSEIRANMFSEITSVGSDLILYAKFNEGVTNPVDYGTNSRTFTATGAIWAGAGTFTYGTSTLVMAKSGTQKINFLSGEDIYNLTVNDGSTTELHCLNTASGLLDVYGDVIVNEKLKSSSNSTNTSLRFREVKTLTIGSDVKTTALSDLYALNLRHSNGTIDLPELTTQRVILASSTNCTARATGDLTITQELELGDGRTFNANGNTINVKNTDVNGGTLDLRNSTLNFYTGASDTWTMSSTSTLTTGNTTVTGDSTRTPTNIPESAGGGFEIVGDVSNLDVTGDLTVIGSVTNCIGNIRQWHHTLDTQQLLDADEAGDDDLRLEKPNLDNANELQTG